MGNKCGSFVRKVTYIYIIYIQYTFRVLLDVLIFSAMVINKLHFVAIFNLRRLELISQ